MAHPELLADLRAAISSARKKDAPVVTKGILINDDGKSRTLAIKVVPIQTSTHTKERYFTIFFEAMAYVEKPKESKKNRTLSSR